MFESIVSFFKSLKKSEDKKEKTNSKDKAKERLHLVLMQDRANVSADFLEMMKQEIIEVIKKYIEVDEKEIDVRLTNDVKEDGTTGAPSLYANIPIVNIRSEMKKEITTENEKSDDSKKNKEPVADKIESKEEKGIKPEKDEENKNITDTEDEEKIIVEDKEEKEKTEENKE